MDESTKKITQIPRTMKDNKRRKFIRQSLATGLGFGILTTANAFKSKTNVEPPKKVGMIGLDTGHSVAFVKALNSAKNNEFDNYKVVAAYPKGTDNILEWKNRIPEFTAEVKRHGVEIVNSISELVQRVDFVILTTIDGNKHLEQALPVFEAGLPVFIDKPFAASIEDARKIAKGAKKYSTPMFSSSSLRFLKGADKIRNGSLGSVYGVEAYSPAHIEPHHPDLFWYAVHGIEILFTLMGTGCKWVERTFTNDTDLVIGMWDEDRIGTFRGIRKGKGGYGAVVYAEDGIEYLNKFDGYNGLLHEIIKFFETKKPPVAIQETLEIFAFMEAAEQSKHLNGERIYMNTI